LKKEETYKYDLEERLIEFAIAIIKLGELLPKTRAGITLGSQIVRSGTSPALNYGEAQAAESRRDFIHKFGIILKELRETKVCLKIIKGAGLLKNTEIIAINLKEVDELIAIYVKSISTAKKKMIKQ